MRPRVRDVRASNSSFRGTRPYAVLGVGADAYLSPRIGVGTEIRFSLMDGPASVSSAEIGLRLRLAQ